MTQYQDLIERMKAATGPDRELDCRLSHHFDRKGISYGTGDDSGWAPAKVVDGWDDAEWRMMGTEHVSSYVSHYTASIDAALALVERCLPGWRYDIHSPRFGRPFEAVLMDGDSASRRIVVGTAPTAPLAILHTVLLVLQSNEATNVE